MKRTKAVFYHESLEGTFTGYANMKFYLRGYAPYFDKETCFRIMEDYLRSNAKYIAENDVEIGYNANGDSFYFEDPNGDICDIWPCEWVETEDGMKTLYAFGEGWMWQSEEEKETDE